MYGKFNYIFKTKEKVKIALLLVMVVIGSFLELSGVAIFSPFIETIMEPQTIMENEHLYKIYQHFGCSETRDFLAIIAVCIIFIYIFKNVFLWMQQDLILKFSYGMQRKLSIKLMKTYLHEPYTFHLNKNIAELQRSIQEDTALFTQGLVHLLQLIAEFAVCGVLGVFLFVISQSITVVVLVLLICCVGLFTNITKRFSKKLGRDAQIYKAKLYQWVNQAIGGVKEVKVLNREEFFVKNYEKYYRVYVKGVRLNKLLSMTPKYIVEPVCMAGLLIAVIVKMFYGKKDDISTFIPQLSTFAVAAFRLLPSVGKINEHVNNILYAAPSLDLIYEDLKGIEDFKKQEIDEHRPWSFQNKIEAKSITYLYPNTDKKILDNTGCVIPKGKTVAFIGGSGAGKTTMVDIILGLLPPQLGKVKADDMNIFKNLSTWHQHIGYIPQTIYLSDDSIRSNVAFGIMEDEIDDEAVMEALKKAQLLEFAESLPEGLDTAVGERGVRISGGQRQRIGIARALYHDPEILVLDEATSALDGETEMAIMESIESLQGTKTILIIAHRLTTIRNADIIYEVCDGKVVERSKEYVFKEN
ncbi:MAG: ABC transporter ATP-binding protein [Lachnospiraceae bacterium]|nr:ABC transporter ATP-binding protein [Lachnospiraceae bacterium]